VKIQAVWRGYMARQKLALAFQLPQLEREIAQLMFVNSSFTNCIQK
jgi:hypothetical protein